jgi:hypothetical protein
MSQRQRIKPDIEKKGAVQRRWTAPRSVVDLTGVFQTHWLRYN